MSGDPGPAVAAPTQQQTQAPAQGAEHAGGGEHAGGAGHDTSFTSKGPIPPVAAGGSAAPGKPSASDQAYGAHHADKPKKKAPPPGFTKSGGGRVKDALVRIANAGKLKITAHQIAQLDALSNVETGGSVASIDTTDDMVVSIGFHQVVLGHKSVEWVIQQAPAAFAKHGIELDMSKTYNVPGWSKPHQIKGVEDPDDLRGHEWGDRFYAASLEDEVIAAIAEWALKEAARVDVKAEKAGAKGNFWQDDTAHAWVLEVDNNREAYTGAAVKRAVAAGANSAKDRDEFLDILAGAIIETYEDLEPKIVGYRKLKEKHHDWDDAKLHSEAERIYRPIGKTKATHIVERIPRKIKVPELNVAAAPAVAPPAATAAPPAQTATAAPAHHDAPVTHTPPPVAQAEPPKPAPPAQHVAAAPPPPAHHEVHTAAATSTVAVPGHLRVKATGLNVRSTPSTEDHGNIVGGLHHGATLEAVSREGEWIAIIYDGRRAFVHGNFVEAMPVHEHEAPVAHATAPAAHHDAPAAHHDAPAVAARQSPAATRAHHDAPAAAAPHAEAAPAQHVASAPAAHHETAAPAPAQHAAPTKQADNSEAVRSQYKLLLNLVELGYLLQADAIAQLVAFDRGLHGGQQSPTGLELAAEFPKAIAQQTKPAAPPQTVATAPTTPAPTTAAPPVAATPGATKHAIASGEKPPEGSSTPNTADHTPAATPYTGAMDARGGKKLDDTSYMASYHHLAGGESLADHPTQPAEATVLNKIRNDTRKLDPISLRTLQEALQVKNATGAMNTETLRKLQAKYPTFSVEALLSGKLVGADLKIVEAGGNGFGPHGDGHALRDGSAIAPGERKADAMAKVGGYDSYQQMNDSFVKLSLFGQPLGKGQPFLAERLKLADAYLRQRIPEAAGITDQKKLKAIAQQKLQWDGTGNGAYADNADDIAKASGGRYGAHFHANGLAIDINPEQNPYVFASGAMTVHTKNGEEKSISGHLADNLRYAAQIFGGEEVTPHLMKKWSDTLSSEELAAKIDMISHSLTLYIQLCETGTDEEIELRFRNAGYSSAEAKALVPEAKHFARSQDGKSRYWQDNLNRKKAKGLTDHSMELIVALRDVAGLAWGGTEMSEGANGDFMHFDCRHTTVGKKLFEFSMNNQGAEPAGASADHHAPNPQQGNQGSGHH